jgi:N,N'-diacetyllegionaminate synthase
MKGPDHQASLEPEDFRQLVRQIRNTELAMGSHVKYAAPSEVKNIVPARKSVVASCDIRQGEAFDERNLALKRPGNGLSPSAYWDLLGRQATRGYAKDELIQW